VLLAVSAVQMMLARPGPVFPGRISARSFETRCLVKVVRRVVPVTRFMERFIRPRWATSSQTTERLIGGVVLLYGIRVIGAAAAALPRDGRAVAPA
jgi:hypothetical protein